MPEGCDPRQALEARRHELQEQHPRFNGEWAGRGEITEADVELALAVNASTGVCCGDPGDCGHRCGVA